MSVLAAGVVVFSQGSGCGIYINEACPRRQELTMATSERSCLTALDDADMANEARTALMLRVMSLWSVVSRYRGVFVDRMALRKRKTNGCWRK